MAAKTAMGELRKALTKKLKDLGYAPGGKTGVWPRVEITEVTEAGEIDKGYDVRELGFIIMAISNLNYQEVETIMAVIDEGLIGCGTITMSGFTCIEIYKELETDSTDEVGDADQKQIWRRTQYRANVCKN